MNKQSQWETADICLVSMPYYNPQLPSLALGLLQAALAREGIKTKSIYANLLFNEQIGVEAYQSNQYANPPVPIAEWSFASSAFPEFQADEDSFLKRIHKVIGKKRNQTIEELRTDMRFVRQEAEKFTVDLAKEILKMSPRIVACTSSLAQKVPSLALLRKIHELNPDVITLMGGADCETIMGRAIHEYFPWVDYVVSGEGDDIIVSLAYKIFELGRHVPAESLPKGVIGPIHREMSYEEIGGEDFRAFSSSFAQQITPTYDDYFSTLNSLPIISKRVRPSLPIQASRGCWYGKCKFCGLNAPHTSYRSRPASQVLSEMDELNSRYGVKHFEFLDNILDMKHFEDLIPELIRREAPYKIFFEIRSNLSKKQLKLLRSAGVTKCQPGIESLHSSALKEMRKGVTAWQNLQTLKWCHQFGIRISWSIICDFPGDKDEWYQEMAELIPLIIHLYPPGGLNSVQYHRNSHYFSHREEYNLKLIPLPLDSYIYPLKSEAIKELSYTLENEYDVSIRDIARTTFLFQRPGLEKLKSALLQWKMLDNSENKPILTMKVRNDKLLIVDTRPIATAHSFKLVGLQKDIYLECDKAIKETELRQNYLDNGYSTSEINLAIDFLLGNKLLLRIDQRLLALAIEEPYLEYCLFDQSPLGWISDL